MENEDKHKPQEDTFDAGPFSLLTKTVKSNAQVLVLLRNNRKILARVRAFDRHLFILIYLIIFQSFFLNK